MPFPLVSFKRHLRINLELVNVDVVSEKLLCPFNEPDQTCETLEQFVVSVKRIRGGQLRFSPALSRAESSENMAGNSALMRSNSGAEKESLKMRKPFWPVTPRDLRAIVSAFRLQPGDPGVRCQ